MDELIELSAASGPITKEKAEKIRQDLAELIQQGAAAVPAIQDFLAKNREFNYEGGEGAEILGFPSMRASLIDALDQIGGPEAQGAMLQAIKTSATPAELLALANSLEKQAPGQYRDEILNAAQETLAMAATNQLQLGTNVELGPAFRMLRAYGDANTTADVSKTEPGNFYDAVVLASLPDGQGLPSLIQMAENSGSSQGGAMEMIAQLAGQNADALAALVGLAQKGQIPNSLWVRLASILGGEQYQIGGSAGQNAPGSQNYHIVSAATTPEEINQRISIIDALMPIVPEDSSAAHALSQQHDFLTAKLSQ